MISYQKLRWAFECLNLLSNNTRQLPLAAYRYSKTKYLPLITCKVITRCLLTLSVDNNFICKENGTDMIDAEKLLIRQHTANSFINVRDTLSTDTGSWKK